MEQNSLAITMEEACCETAQQAKARRAARRRELAKVKAKKKQDAEAYRKRRESEFAVMGWLPRVLEAKAQEITDKYFGGNRGKLVGRAVEHYLDLVAALEHNGAPEYTRQLITPIEVGIKHQVTSKRRWWAFWRKAA